MIKKLFPVLLIALILSSCNKPEDIIPAFELLYGDWGAESRGGGFKQDLSQYDYSLTLNRDGTYSYKSPDRKIHAGKFSIIRNRLKNCQNIYCDYRIRFSEKVLDEKKLHFEFSGEDILWLHTSYDDGWFLKLNRK